MGAPTAVVHVVRRMLASTLATVLVLGAALALATPQQRPAGTSPVTRATDLAPAAEALPSATYRTFTLNVCHCLAPAKAMADVRRVIGLADGIRLACQSEPVTDTVRATYS